MDFPFATREGDLYSVTMRQASCTEGLCCSLRAAGGGLERVASFLHETSPDPNTNIARLLLEPPDGGEINVRVTALNRCRFDTPVLASASGRAAASYEITATGQEPNTRSGHGEAQTFDHLFVTRVGGRLFLHDTSRRGVSLAEDASISTLKFLPNTTDRNEGRLILHQAANAGALDEAAVDAHGYSQIVHDYIKSRWEINSYDERGGSMLAVTELDYPIAPREFCGVVSQPGTRYNAFWWPSNRFIAFTDSFPDNDRWWDDWELSVALDVVAHEWGHAVTDHFSDLVYERESGALNEAFSDWMAAAVEHHVRGNGTYLCYEGGSCAHAVWLIGEDAAAIRSIADPAFFDDPDTYRGDNWMATDETSCPDPDVCENDYCGVHSNSGVGNKMFYLLASGGTFNGVRVRGIGIQNAMLIAASASRNHWSRASDFRAARSGMIEAAMTFDRRHSTRWVDSVRAAWSAVGVE